MSPTARRAGAHSSRRASDQGDASAALSACERAQLELEGLAGTDSWLAPLARHAEALSAQSARFDLLPFVGRQAELSSLLTRWTEVVAGGSAQVVVEGRSGEGKSRLLLEFTERVREGHRVSLACESAQAVEWGLVSDLTSRLLALAGARGVSRATDAVLGALLPSQFADVSEWSVMPPDAVVCDALLDLLGAVAHEEAVLLTIDDAHLMDSASARVIERLGGRLPPHCFLLTARLGRNGSNTDGSIGLKPLARADVNAVVGTMALDEGASDLLYERSQGSPFLLQLLVQDLLALRALGRDYDEGTWRDLPHSVGEHWEHRLAGLSEDAVVLLAGIAKRDGGVRRSDLRKLGRDRNSDAISAAFGELLQNDLIVTDDAGRVALAHETLRGPAVKNGPASTLKRKLAVAAVAAALAVAAIVSTRGPSGPLALAEPGQILLMTLDSIMTVRLPATSPDQLRIEPYEGALPRMSVVGPVRRRPDGSVRWFGSRRSPEEAPYALVVDEGRPPTELLRRSGLDIDSRTASPGGEWVVVTAQRPGMDTYTTDFIVVDMSGHEVARLNQDDGYGGTADWSPDGSKILIQRAGIPARIVAVTPGGDVLGEVSLLRGRVAGHMAWCSDSSTALVSIRSEGVNRLHRLEFVPELRLTALAEGWHVRDAGLVCLDDLAVFVGVHDSSASLVVYDTARDSTWSVLLRDVPPVLHLRWLPDDPVPYVTALRISAPSRSLSAGDRVHLEAHAEWSDGASRPIRPRWASLSPEVIAIGDSGDAIAIRSGHALVTATHFGLRSDTVELDVAAVRSRSALLYEEPADDWATRWVVEGYPAPELVDGDGGPYLSLTGDGMYRDGILSRESFDLARGATLSADFRLWPLSRSSGQTFSMCLVDAQLPAAPDEAWGFTTGTCFRYPAEELDYFDPDRAAQGFPWLGVSPTLSVKGVLPTVDWVNVRLEIGADGSVRLYLNGDLASAPDFRVAKLGDGTLFRVTINARAVETDVWVRNIMLREGVGR